MGWASCTGDEEEQQQQKPGWQLKNVIFTCEMRADVETTFV